MSDQFVSEIRMLGGSYAPNGWATCDGQSLTLAQNTTLFTLLGTTYGGDGVRNFNLPNLQGRAALSFGQGSGLSQRALGSTGGETTVSLQTTQAPSHNHSLVAGVRGAMPVQIPSEVTYLTSIVDQSSGVTYASGNPSTVQMNAQAIQSAGNGAVHNNMQPYLGVLFAIALVGIYPPRP